MKNWHLLAFFTFLVLAVEVIGFGMLYSTITDPDPISGMIHLFGYVFSSVVIVTGLFFWCIVFNGLKSDGLTNKL